MSALGIICTIIIGSIIIFYGLKADKNTVKLLILLCFFQNIFILIFSPYLKANDYIILVFLKEILVYITIIGSFLKKRKVDKVEICSIVALFVQVVYLIFRMDFSMTTIASFRQLSIPFVFYLFGRSVRLQKDDFIEIIRLFVKICIFSVLFGLFQIIIGPSFFDKLGMKNYMILKYGRVTMYGEYCVPSSMISYDLMKFTGKTYYRMASILVDPVIISQLLALAFVLVSFDYSLKLTSENKKKICSILLAVGILATMGKGGIVIAILTWIFIWGKKNIQRKMLSYALYAVVGFACLMILVGSSNGSSFDMHMSGLTESILVLKDNPLGKGIGTEGNMAVLYGADTEAIGESFVGALMAQMGFVGVFSYVFFIWELYIKYKKVRGKNSIYDNIYFATNSMWITSLLNNTSISFTSCFMYFIVLGFSEDIM